MFVFINDNLFDCLVLFWCTIQPSYADTNEGEYTALDIIDEDNSSNDEIGDLVDLHQRASLRPFFLHQRKSIQPFVGKLASLRPFVGKRASLRPFTGKRASLRQARYINQRK